MVENSVHSLNAQSGQRGVEVPRLAYRFRQASKAISAIVASLGLVVLGGWAFNVPALTYIRSSFQSMKVNTALSFLCLGVGLWLAQDKKWQRIRRILGLFVVVVAGLTLVEYAFHVSVGIDQLLFRDTRTPSLSAYPGRMAIATATCFVLLGLAVALLGTKKAVALRHSLVAVCFALSLVALCGYLYGVHSLYSITAFSTVAVHTAAGFFAACLAYFLSQPDQGILSIAASETNSGLLLRTVVPAIIVLPIVIGWLRLAGQRAGLYDTPFGVALQVLGSIGCLTALTLVIARSMHRLELERSKAEEARIRSAAIVESSDDAIAALDMGGTITDWNKGAERLFGYSASEAIGKNILLLSPADARDDAKGVLKKVWQGEVVRHHEAVRRRKDGTSVDISLTVSPIVDPQGRIVGASGVARDITERKQAERELSTATERLHLAIESGSVGGWDYDLKTGKKVWFGETHAQLGMAADETPGSFEESWGRIHKDDREHLQHALRVARDKHEQFTEEFRVVGRDGTTRWLRSRGRFFYAANGEPERLLGLSVDITQRKLAEDALQESEERFRLVANAAPVMIWMSGVDKEPTYFNQLWQDFTGLSETDLRKGLARIVHPDDYPQCHEVYCRGFDQRQPFTKECRLRRHDGEYRWMLDIGVPRFHKDGSFAGYIGSCVDVTDRKLAEEALSGMTRKLVEAQEQERARIARELHDDINQRLALLAVQLEQVRENNVDLPSEVLSTMQELQKQTTEISNDVQAISHDLHSSQLEYLGIVAGMKSWCKEFAERQKMEIDCRHDVRSTLPREIGLCLLRVLQEALHNAAKHSGVKRAEVELSEHSGEIRLTIRDLGKGFDVEAARQGRGLGLTSMRERVRLVNGTIDIQSKLMGGTIINVRVPFGSEKPSERAVG
jgi:PAS domain S-box-containing protein